MKFAKRVCTHAYTHIAVHTHTQVQDSLPGTRQQCAAKWDVWEPPAAKRRTGRRNKPSLMETWHARRGGNSNKRLMGHGAFSTAAKYPPLHSPLLSVLSLCPMLAEGVCNFNTQAPTPRRHISLTHLPQSNWDPLLWIKSSMQYSYRKHARGTSCTE